jgi:hypothetical protein
MVQMTVDTSLVPLDRIKLLYCNFAPIYTPERQQYIELPREQKDSRKYHVKCEHPELYYKILPDEAPSVRKKQHKKLHLDLAGNAVVPSNRQSIHELTAEYYYYKKGRRVKNEPVDVDRLLEKNPDCQLVLNGSTNCHGDYRSINDVIDYDYCCNECGIDVLRWSSDHSKFIVSYERKPTTHFLISDFATVNSTLGEESKGAILFRSEEMLVLPKSAYWDGDDIAKELENVHQSLADNPSDVIKHMTFYSHSLAGGHLSYVKRHNLKPGRNYAFLSCANAFGEIFSAPCFFEGKDEVYYYCLRGSGAVRLSDGSCKPVCDLAIGDHVQSISPTSGALESSTVLARSVDCRRDARMAAFEFVCVNGQTWVTPEHPIRLDGHWRRPHALGACIVALAEESAVYNFVLVNRSSLFVNGVEVATLGQYCEGIDSVDSFFGSERVVRHLQSNASWPNVIR